MLRSSAGVFYRDKKGDSGAMPNLSQRAARLSLEKRAILAQRLQADKLALRASDRTAPVPLSFAQQPIWLVEQIESGSLVHHRPAHFQLTGPLNQAALQRSLDEIVGRHESLRARFPVIEGQPKQVVDPASPVHLSTLDLSEMSSIEQDDRLQAIIQKDAQTPFDLGNGPLLRAMLVKQRHDQHVLLLTFHHIVFDGWSARVLHKELAGIYASFAADLSSPLPPLDHQYADFSIWQHRQLSDQSLKNHLSYWQQHLSGTLPVLNMPSDYPRLPIQRFRGATYESEVSTDVTKRLKTLSRQQEVALFMTLFAGFNLLLGRHSNQQDIIVGVPVSGRNLAEVEPLIGLFTDNLPLRTDLSGSCSLERFLQQIKSTVLNGFSHQAVPFGKIVEAIQPVRELSRSLVFQTQFQLQNLPVFAEQKGKLAIAELSPPYSSTAFDLTLEITEADSKLLCRFKYNSDLFNPSTIERLSEHFHCLLNSLPDYLHRSIAEIPMLSEAEQEQLLVTFNRTQQPYKQQCIHQLFEQQASHRPDSIAARYDNQTLTYRQLNQQANQLAHLLRDRGVKPGIRVCLCIERSLPMLVAHLAILKAGGAYVPLDADYPTERIAYMAADAQPLMAVTEQRHRHLFADLPTLCVDLDRAEIAQQPVHAPNCDVKLEDTAYIIYTSGSTGKPKGVVIRHRGLTNLLCSLAQAPGLTADDKLLAITTICFDMAALELYLPLIVGGQVVITSREIAMDGSRLRQQMEAEGITVMQGTPATWQLLLANGWKPTPVIKVLCGGEAMPPTLAEAILAGGGMLWNMYGPTETTVYSSRWLIRNASDATCIGRPLANTQLYVLDEALQPAPIGVAGELYIGGDGLAQGYFNRPQLNAERFIPSPFENLSDAIQSRIQSASPADSRLYKTGDLARYRADGAIDYLGRIDRQVKIRGFRIELGELEALLKQHPAVEQSLVVAQKDALGYSQIVGYVVISTSSTTAEKSVSESALKSYLKEKVPVYMVPAAIVVLAAFPLMPNGKIDVRSLPAPCVIESTDTFVAPRDRLESQLQKIWQETLAREPIGIQDDFFDVGGHSLMAIQLLSKIEQVCGRSLPLTGFLRTPTIAAQASLLRSGSPAEQTGLNQDESPESSLHCLAPIRTVVSPAEGAHPIFCVHGAGGGSSCTGI